MDQIYHRVEEKLRFVKMSIPHVVFIDDESDILYLLEIQFRNEIKGGELKMSFIKDSHDALELIEKNDDISAVITDINMPSVDGFEILKKLKNKKSDALLYLCSAYDRDDYDSRASELEVKHFFKKPVDIKELKNQILEDLKGVGVLA